MRNSLTGSCVAMAMAFAAPAWSLTATEVLQKMDAAEYSAQDNDATVKLVLADKDGTKSERRLQMFQKGAKLRLIKFLDPADVKGIAFLDTGDDQMFLYMPALHKIRRIAGHVKNDTFAGTDFAYQDLQAGEFSKRVEAVGMTEDDKHFVLDCRPKPGTDSDYGKMKISIRKQDFLFDRIDFFDSGGTLWKVLTREDFRPAGKYTQSYLVQMKDEKKGHSTQMLLESYKSDVGLKDSFFSKRQLKR